MAAAENDEHEQKSNNFVVMFRSLYVVCNGDHKILSCVVLSLIEETKGKVI